MRDQQPDPQILHYQMQLMNLDKSISPQYRIPQNKIQIKQQYLNKQFIQAKVGAKSKSQGKHNRVNHSMIYDQVKNLNDSAGI